MALHINIEDLLSARTVESDRIEFKEGWNPDAIYRSIGAFANDFDNIGGGYILIGVAEAPLTKTALRPVIGLTTKQIGDIQQQMIGYNNLLKPYYAPRLFVEEVDGRQIIVLWVNGGNERPYEVPETITAKHKTWKYFIRKYANSIEAKASDKEELISFSSNIPFDDRINNKSQISDISMLRLKDYLQKVNSKLATEVGQKSDSSILAQMALISGPNEQLFPRNVALMLFTDAPHQFFPYTWVEIIYFPKGAADKEFTEKKIEGPVHQQITDTLHWLKTNYLQEKVRKIPNQAEAERSWNYPYPALEEAVANCLFHRNYQEREPITIRIEPNAIFLYNLGGPDRSINKEDFNAGRVIPRRYRNRRLGDFLKELKLTEGHSTGIPALKKAMQQNGSPEPVFDFDEDRTWFQVMLPIHPAFENKQPINLNLANVIWDFSGIDNLINQLLEYTGFYGVSGINSNQVGNQADLIQMIDIQAKEILNLLPNNQVSTIAASIAGCITEKQIIILENCLTPKARETVLVAIKLSNQRKNYVDYMLPLVALNWLAMTIPNKPTSPKQQYLTTLKGRLILEFLNSTEK